MAQDAALAGPCGTGGLSLAPLLGKAGIAWAWGGKGSWGCMCANATSSNSRRQFLPVGRVTGFGVDLNSDYFAEC